MNIDVKETRELLLKHVPSVEVRRMIRSRIKTLIKDINKATKLTNEFGWEWRMRRDEAKARKELMAIENKLFNNYYIQQEKKETN